MFKLEAVKPRLNLGPCIKQAWNPNFHIFKYSIIYESSDSMLVEYMGPSSVWALMLVT